MKQPTTYNTALYLRLSRDDGMEQESSSIQTQKEMLTRYCHENGFTPYQLYIDDGWSGTNSDRPDFQRMLSDIEDGKINCVITKDLSRLGRNYLETGGYTEIFFPEHGVRYIAVTDGVDTAKGSTMDITPFKNLLNDMYVADIVVLVKSVARFAQKRYGVVNRFESVSPPKSCGKTDKRLFSAAEQSRLKAFLLKNPDCSNVGILLSMVTGIRIGELCALRWQDIDLEKSILTVRQTVQRIMKNGGGTKLIITAPKSTSSVREIPLPDFIMPVLKKIQADKDAYLLSGNSKIIEPRTMQYGKEDDTFLKISECGFSKSAVNELTNMGIIYLQDISLYSRLFISRVRSIGSKSLRQIDE